MVKFEFLFVLFYVYNHDVILTLYKLNSFLHKYLQ